MTRWSIRILFALVLGAATTIAIGLACARWSRPTMMSDSGLMQIDVDAPDTNWVTARDGRWFFDENGQIDPSLKQQRALKSLARRIALHYPNITFVDRSTGNSIITGRGVLLMRAVRWEGQVLPPGLPGTPQIFRYDMIEKQYGWPLLCLSSGDHESSSSHGTPGTVNWGVIQRDTVERYHGRPSSGGGEILDMPRVILWPGFIANTLLFGVPWLLGVAGIHRYARIRLRRRRGWCPVCVYDLRGDFAAGCPECGWNRAA